MAYQVLARKWRPRSFDEVAGQAHVLRALSNGLDQGRLHHAYLFVGERGVGKTTLARILAKCLNCENGVTARPCGQCSACVEIDQGRFIDLIEVDAASRTKVEDTRELLENVQYRPTRGRYKVYLIDEVHMLSNHSFNALLKTLEEPPEHVKFLLATTDPQKLPVTVLSRCLQFNLKRMPVTVILGQLEKILSEEGASAEPGALLAIARAAQGSMRDALSLLDQALAYGAGVLRETEVHEMLGTAPRGPWQDLVMALARTDLDGALAAVAELAGLAADFSMVLDDMLSLIHQAALAQVCPQALSIESADTGMAQELGRALSAEMLQLYYQIALIGKRDLPLAPDARSGFEMIVLRMLRFTRGAVPERVESGSTASLPKPGILAQTSSPASEAAPKINAQASRQLPAAVSSRKLAADELPAWALLVTGLGLKGLPDSLARNCCLVSISESEVRLKLAKGHAGLATEKSRQRLQETLSAYLGRALRLYIEIGALEDETPAKAAVRESDARLATAQQSLESDPVVRNLKAKFGARLIEGSVRVFDPAESVKDT